MRRETCVRASAFNRTVSVLSVACGVTLFFSDLTLEAVSAIAETEHRRVAVTVGRIAALFRVLAVWRFAKHWRGRVQDLR